MTTPIIDADKTRISLPIPMIVTILIGLAGIGGSLVAKASSWSESQQAQASSWSEGQQAQDLRIQRLEDRYDHIAKSLDEIKVELKEQRRDR